VVERPPRLNEVPEREPQQRFQELRKRGRVAFVYSAHRSGVIMEQHDDFKERPYFVAVRAKLGEALREQHDLMEPLPQGLVELLARLETSVRIGEVTRERLFAEIDECIAAMVHAAYGKPDPGEA
jgi:hypothetical protein